MLNSLLGLSEITKVFVLTDKLYSVKSHDFKLSIIVLRTRRKPKTKICHISLELKTTFLKTHVFLENQTQPRQNIMDQVYINP